LRPAPRPEAQVLMVMSPSDRVAPLYPQAPGPIFVASYDLQSCGGRNPLRFHTQYNGIHCYPSTLLYRSCE
jgi:hypothetical protein